MFRFPPLRTPQCRRCLLLKGAANSLCFYFFFLCPNPFRDMSSLQSLSFLFFFSLVGVSWDRFPISFSLSGQRRSRNRHPQTRSTSKPFPLASPSDESFLTWKLENRRRGYTAFFHPSCSFSFLLFLFPRVYYDLLFEAEGPSWRLGSCLSFFPFLPYDKRQAVLS